MILHHVQTAPEHIPAMQNGACTVRFLSWWQKDTEIYKACSILKHASLGIYWKCPICKKNGKRKITFQEERIPSSTRVHSSIGQSGIQNWCQSVFIQAFPACAGASATAPLNISCLSNFHAPANDSKDIDSLHQSKHHVVALTCRGSASWYARLVFLPD